MANFIKQITVSAGKVTAVVVDTVAVADQSPLSAHSRLLGSSSTSNAVTEIVVGSNLLLIGSTISCPTGGVGPAGPKGDDGDVGPKGDDGDVGPAGPKGDKGDDGDVGPKGDDGDVGPKGDDGDVGPKGDDGDVGPKGDDGDVGPAGPIVYSSICKYGVD